MLKPLLAIFVLGFSVACAHQDASVQNSNKQEQWPGSDQSAKSRKSTTTETGANTPAGEGDKNDHTENLAKPADQVPAPKAIPGDVGQGNDKNPKKQGTTSGPNPHR
jgi:hypothetical protein